ncbi:MAG TPA: MogA/MoaB family molybdenum cofactor biosynthesis protein [Propionibacteriaceae bacterium]|nr:MogA/MoaB family molybdenum cofactor biosynthesis protein [Propionibacteriaceae bacterium]
MTAAALVITVSTRASAGTYEDVSGPILAAALAELDFEVDGPLVVPDGDQVGQALRDGVQQGYAVILTTGGTGLNPHDHTPEQTRPVLDFEIPQLPAAIARYGVDAGVPTALLSRGLAGVAGRSLVVNLPGSAGAARDAIAVLGPVLRHAVSQIQGGDH